MRILFLSQLVPYPPDAGPKVRSYHVLQYLASRAHQVTLVAFSRDTDRTEEVEHLRKFCAEVHTVNIARSRARDLWHLSRSILRREPFLITRDHSAEMHKTIHDVLSRHRFDAIHADQLWMAPYAQAASRLLNGVRSSPRLILDQHNAVFLIPKRLAKVGGNPGLRKLMQREAMLLERYERAVCEKFDEVVWVTDEDRLALGKSSAVLASGTTIPICVDTHTKAVVRRLPHARRVTFLGGLHWPPNADGMRWFASEVWPLILRQVPGAIVTVIGKEPPAELDPARIPGLEVPGFVADVTPYLAETAVFIVPLHAGGGMRVKIVDAWAYGLPVVTTTIGAEGLAYRNEENLLIADSAEAFADSVIRVVTDGALAKRLGAAGRRTVEECYDWRSVYRAWDVVYGQET